MSEILPVIQTAGLTKVFRDFWRRARVIAVQDLNLEIRPGQVFGLLGPNGSGKSTTIKMLLGLLYPTRGRISLFGKAPTDVAVKARIGFLPEESYLYRFLNARETLDYYGRLFRLPGAVRAERIERLLDMVGLSHEADRRVGEYSKGMARRIGLAQALINDPELLILDEPTSGLDPIGTRQIKDVIRDLGRRGKTVLLSSHLLADVEDVCDRVTILYGGQERAAGTTEELLSRQDHTQITTDRLSEESIAKVRALLEELTHKGRVEVSTPTEPLESFFLRIVRQAQSDNVVTSGARASGELPEFLRRESTDGESVVESLVAAARAPGKTESIEAVTPQPSRPDAAKKLVEQLTRQREPSEVMPVNGPATEPGPSEAPVEADPSVIDALMRPRDSSDDV